MIMVLRRYTPNGLCLALRLGLNRHCISGVVGKITFHMRVFLCILSRPILEDRRHDTTPQIKGYWYIGALVETRETDHRVACKFALTPDSTARATKVLDAAGVSKEKRRKKDAKNTLKRTQRSYYLQGRDTGELEM